MKALRGGLDLLLYSFFEVGGQGFAPAALHPGKRLGVHCTGRWVGPRAAIDGCKNFVPTGIRSPELPACSGLLY